MEEIKKPDFSDIASEQPGIILNPEHNGFVWGAEYVWTKYVLPIKTESVDKDKWISVKERMPEKLVQVLIYGNRGHYAFGCVDSSGEFDDYGLWEGEHVTHWQTVPEPPKV